MASVWLILLCLSLSPPQRRADLSVKIIVAKPEAKITDFHSVHHKGFLQNVTHENTTARLCQQKFFSTPQRLLRNPCGTGLSGQVPFPLDNRPRLFYRKPFGEGKTVQFRRGPAAVTGDESRSRHCPEGREGRPVRRSGSQKTFPLRFAGRPSWDRAEAATPKDKNGVPGQSMSGDFF